MDPIIRPYDDEDGPAVRALFVRVNRQLAPAHMKDAFEDFIALSLREEIDWIPQYYRELRGGNFWVVSAGSDIIGCFGLEPITDTSIELRRMYVDGAWRRAGVGRWMLRYAEETARLDGRRTLVAKTSELQKEAVALYLAAGFTVASEERGSAMTNKSIGLGLRRYVFEKNLAADPSG